MSIFKLGRWSDREKAGVLLAAGVLLLAATYLVVWRPVRVRLADLDVRIRAAERELADNQRILAPGFREAVSEEYRRHGERLRKTLSTPEESAAMLRSIEELATQSGVALAATRPQEVRPGSDSEEYAVELQVESDTPRLLVFLQGIYASPQLLRVPSFDLERKDKNGPLRGRILVTKVVTR